MAEVQNEELGEIETVSEQIKDQESADEKGQSVVDETIPAKYRGKSQKELAEMLESTNKQLGRYTNELGEVRKLADELIKSSLQKPKEPESQKEVDFFENPQEAVRRAVEASPIVQNAANYAAQAQQELAKQKIVQLHPDFPSLVNDQEFLDWVGGSPIRRQLFKQADSFNVDAAHELFSTFKGLRAAKQNAVASTENGARDKALNAAAVDSKGSGETSRKILRRADILKIMMRPEEYRARQAEIELAYAEGRVK